MEISYTHVFGPDAQPRSALRSNRYVDIRSFGQGFVTDPMHADDQPWEKL